MRKVAEEEEEAATVGKTLWPAFCNYSVVFFSVELREVLNCARAV